jgi:murein DD-endopeptidase MepM/ murein hydrolase activator NlpD
MRLPILTPPYSGIFVLIVLLLSSLTFLQMKDRKAGTEEGFFDVTLPRFFDGLPCEHYAMETRELRSNDILGSLLAEFGIPASRHYPLIQSCGKAFNLKTLREGQKFHVFRNPRDCRVDWLIYEPGPYRAYKIRLDDEPRVQVVERPVEVVRRQRSGQIRSSLWNAMIDSEMPIPLIVNLESALECAVDFHHLQKGDHFKVIYDEDQLYGERIGLGRMHAVSFTQGDTTVHAIYYEKDSIKGYYDLLGRPMKSMFLKAPVRFSRISSHFSPSRLHPILKVRRPHMGTDYAAPYGTEILAVADGVVTEAAHRGGNGIYVKIRHNSTYETQYLHMQRHANGIRPGVRVRQGQVIGFVGSTGLATGPHVCFRFWKHGRQVNHLRERLPEAIPMPSLMLPEYFAYRDKMVAELNGIPVIRESMRPAPGSAPLTHP